MALCGLAIRSSWTKLSDVSVAWSFLHLCPDSDLTSSESPFLATCLQWCSPSLLGTVYKWPGFIFLIALKNTWNSLAHLYVYLFIFCIQWILWKWVDGGEKRSLSKIYFFLQSCGQNYLLLQTRVLSSLLQKNPKCLINSPHAHKTHANSYAHTHTNEDKTNTAGQISHSDSRSPTTERHAAHARILSSQIWASARHCKLGTGMLCLKLISKVWNNILWYSERKK